MNTTTLNRDTARHAHPFGDELCAAPSSAPRHAKPGRHRAAGRPSLVKWGPLYVEEPVRAGVTLCAWYVGGDHKAVKA